MSNDVRGMLRGAAKVPSTDADVAGAWRRGRRMRIQPPRPERHRDRGRHRARSRRHREPAPERARLDSGRRTGFDGYAPGVRHAHDGDHRATVDLESPNPPIGRPRAVVARRQRARRSPFGILCAHGRSDRPRRNKILWIVRQPRDGQPLEITATLAGLGREATMPSRSSRIPGPVRSTRRTATTCSLPGAGTSPSRGTGTTRRSTFRPARLPIRRRQHGHDTGSDGHHRRPPATAAVTTCHTAALGITISGPIGSAGHFNYEIQFRNNGASACVMTGFPGVSFLDSSRPPDRRAGRTELDLVRPSRWRRVQRDTHLSMTDPPGSPAPPR